MTELSSGDFLRLTAILPDLYGLRDRASLVDFVLGAMPDLISADLFSYIEADPIEGRFAAVRKPVPDRDEMLDIFAPMAPEHPIIRHVAASAATEAFRVGDFVSSLAWRAMPMYSEFMRPERIEHQLGVALPVHTAVMTFLAAHRSSGHDFSDRDRAMLTQLAPHVSRALLNAELMTRLEQGGEVIEATRSGRIRWTTATARRWLGDYFGQTAARGDRLPEALRLDAPLPGAPPSDRPLIRERGSRRLSIRRFWRGEVMVVVLTEDEFTSPRLKLEQLGLSRREIDVVLWLTAGKTNIEIGEILEISPATVKKHLVKIFDKLGVDGRTAAALLVRDLAASRR